MGDSQRKRKAVRPPGGGGAGGSEPGAPPPRSRGGGRTRSRQAAGAGRRDGAREPRRLALDLHVTAPGVGEGDRFHRIEQHEPLKVHGIVWPFGDGEEVLVDLVVEELRAQVLIPEDVLPRLQVGWKAGEEVPGSGAEASGLKPERVQARGRRAVARVSGTAAHGRRGER